MPENVLEKRALINGEWVESESGERFEVHYPGDGRVVGTAPNAPARMCSGRSKQQDKVSRRWPNCHF
jgi:acyl-CoA reductase-like NAD-dependent aldehyde dehydrogenase